jgi:3-oxoacyl-[acyl-carrier protein] reductase
VDLKLTGAAVLITGASRGLGRDFAVAFAAEGARVAICARDAAGLEAAAAEVRARGAECVPIVADLFKAEDCRKVVDATAKAFDRLDVLINNASTNVEGTPRSLEDATDAQLMERFLGKTMASIRCARAAIPHMRRTGGGRIVCIGGTAARSVLRSDETPSLGSGLPQGLGNSSLANFAKHLSEEVARDGILVNVVHPHLTRTSRHAERVAKWADHHGIDIAEAEARLAKRIPIGRIVEPADIIPIVLLLSSQISAGITGQAIAVDGGALAMVSY